MNGDSEENSNKSEGESSRIELPLQEAVNAAETLLRYATEHGKEYAEEDIKTIVHSKHVFSSGELSEKEEGNFWNAYRKLCVATHPVSRESLKATTDELRHSWFGIRNISESGRAVLYYQRITIVSIIILLSFQIYWVFVSSLVDDIRKVQTSLVPLDAKSIIKESEKQTLLASLKKLEMDEKNTGKKPDDEKVKQISDQITKLNSELQELKINTNSLREKRNSNLVLLTKLDIVGKWATTTEEDWSILKNQDVWRLQTGAITLEIMSLYILPILYGLLGACAYILRTISQEIKNRTFTYALMVRLKLRMVLGSLAGFAIAWFMGEEGTVSGELSQLIVERGGVAPLALAFVAGYSVELLFTAMDTIVKAFVKADIQNEVTKKPSAQ